MGIEALADPLEALALILGMGSFFFGLARLAVAPDQRTVHIHQSRAEWRLKAGSIMEQEWRWPWVAPLWHDGLGTTGASTLLRFGGRLLPQPGPLLR
jgi:hypothetical protein